MVVNDRYTTEEDGTVVTVERTPEEITRIGNLVKDAIGFDLQRGDSVQVVSESFFVPAPPEPLPEPPIWEEAWFWDIVREGGGWLLALLLILLVVRPVMSRMLQHATVVHTHPQMAAAGAAGGVAGGMAGAYPGGQGGEGMGELGSEEEALHLPGPRSYEKTLDAARNMIADDPKRVAQVVRKWISEDGKH